jgi:hypothetical protein
MNLADVECSIAESRAGKFTHQLTHYRCLSNDHFTKEHKAALIKYAAEVTSQVKDRLSQVDQKLRGILTLCGAITTFLAGLALTGRPEYLFVGIPIVLAVFLVAHGLSVYQYQYVVLSDAELSGSADLEQVGAISAVNAANHNMCVADFLVDCYRASLRYVFFALVLLGLVSLFKFTIASTELPVAPSTPENSQAPTVEAGPPDPPKPTHRVNLRQQRPYRAGKGARSQTGR